MGMESRSWNIGGGISPLGPEREKRRLPAADRVSKVLVPKQSVDRVGRKEQDVVADKTNAVAEDSPSHCKTKGKMTAEQFFALPYSEQAKARREGKY